MRGRRPHKPIVVGVEHSHLPREKRRQCVRSAAGSGTRAKCNNEALTAVRAQRAWSCSQRGCPAAVNVDPLRRSFATASMKSSMRWLRVRNSGIFACYNGSAQPTAWLGRAQRPMADSPRGLRSLCQWQGQGACTASRGCARHTRDGPGHLVHLVHLVCEMLTPSRDARPGRPIATDGNGMTRPGALTSEHSLGKRQGRMPVGRIGISAGP